MQTGISNKMFDLMQVGYCFHPEAIVSKGKPWKPAIFPSIVGLLKHPQKGYMLFDTGYAARFNNLTLKFPEKLYRLVTPMTLPEHESLIQQLKNKGISTEDIKYIFISHFHADHIAGLLDFPAAKFIASKKAVDNFLNHSGIHAVIKGYIKALLPTDFIDRLSFIESFSSVALDRFNPFNIGYDILGDGSYFAIELPGHAAGHFGLLFSDGSISRFLVGDACWTDDAFKKGVRPNRISGLIMDNWSQYLATLNRLNVLYDSNKDVSIIPSHCSNTFDLFHQDSCHRNCKT